jgi:hypothetical protein
MECKYRGCGRLCVELSAVGFAQKGTKKRGKARCCTVVMHGRQIASNSQGGVVNDLPTVVDRQFPSTTILLHWLGLYGHFIAVPRSPNTSVDALLLGPI